MILSPFLFRRIDAEYQLPNVVKEIPPSRRRVGESREGDGRRGRTDGMQYNAATRWGKGNKMAVRPWSFLSNHEVREHPVAGRAVEGGRPGALSQGGKGMVAVAWE